MTTDLLTLQPNSDPSAAWLECASRWLEAVERRRGSARSRHEYQKILTGFFAFVGKEPQSVAGSDLQRWITNLQESGLAKNTINTRLAAVSSFYSFACAKYEVEPGRYLHSFNPATVVTRQHVNPYEKAQGLSTEQARALLKACDRATIIGARDFAIITFYLYTARRRAEIARLTWGDIRPGANEGSREYHYQGKGDKGGWRDLPAPVWTALEYYLKHSGRLLTMRPDSPLFVATNGKAQNLPIHRRHSSPTLATAITGQEITDQPATSTNNQSAELEQPIGASTISQIVTRAAKLAGLEHVKVHALRHTAAKLRRKAGDGIEEVSKFLDHSNIATTQIYLGSIEAKGDLSWKKVEALLDL